MIGALIDANAAGALTSAPRVGACSRRDNSPRRAELALRATGVRKVTQLKVTQREIAGALRAVITAGLDARRVEISSAGNIIIIDFGGLRRHLNALPRIGVLICTNANGQPTSANGLSGAIRRAVEATPGISAPAIHPWTPLRCRLTNGRRRRDRGAT